MPAVARRKKNLGHFLRVSVFALQNSSVLRPHSFHRHVPLTKVILTQDGAELARATLPPGEYVNERPVTEPMHLFPNQSIRLGPEGYAGAAAAIRAALEKIHRIPIG